MIQDLFNEYQSIDHGMHQGLVLGPKFFMYIYTENDITFNTSSTTCVAWLCIVG